MNLASLHLYVTCMSMALVRCMTGQTFIGWCFLMHFNGIFSLLMMYVIWCIARAFFLRCSFKVIWVRCLCRIWFEVCAMKVSYFFLFHGLWFLYNYHHFAFSENATFALWHALIWIPHNAFQVSSTVRLDKNNLLHLLQKGPSDSRWLISLYLMNTKFSPHDIW